jgi:hypothetical protein
MPRTLPLHILCASFLYLQCPYQHKKHEKLSLIYFRTVLKCHLLSCPTAFLGSTFMDSTNNESNLFEKYCVLYETGTDFSPVIIPYIIQLKSYLLGFTHNLEMTSSVQEDVHRLYVILCHFIYGN